MMLRRHRQARRCVSGQIITALRVVSASHALGGRLIEGRQLMTTNSIRPTRLRPCIPGTVSPRGLFCQVGRRAAQCGASRLSVSSRGECVLLADIVAKVENRTTKNLAKLIFGLL